MIEKDARTDEQTDSMSGRTDEWRGEPQTEGGMTSARTDRGRITSAWTERTQGNVVKKNRLRFVSARRIEAENNFCQLFYIQPIDARRIYQVAICRSVSLRTI